MKGIAGRMREPWERGWAGRVLRRAFLISVGFHAILVLGVVLLPPRSRPVAWPGASIGVSLVALSGPGGGPPGPATAPARQKPPAETQKKPARPPVKKVEKKPEKKPETKPPDPRSGNVKLVPDSAAVGATPGAAAASGNGGGGQGRGGSGSPLQLLAQTDGGAFVYDYYLQTVAEMISRAWEPPAGLTERSGETSAVIRFRILANGRVPVADVETASAIEVFDRSARAAVLRAQPFPPLPPSYSGRWLTIHLKFAYGATQS